jgi:hypothetical protein
MSLPRLLQTCAPFDQALLRAARDDGPPRGAEERALASLGLSASLAASSVVVAQRGRLSSAAWGWTFKAIALVVVGAGVAAAWMGPSERRSLDLVAGPTATGSERTLRAEPVVTARSDSPNPNPNPGAASTSASLVAHGESPRPPERTLAPARRPPMHSAPPRSPLAQTAAASAAVTTAPSTGLDASPLSLEIALVQQAARALAGGEASVAMILLDTYDHECPRGALAAEAGALRVQALMRSGHADEAATLARRLLDGNPRGALAGRLRDMLEGRSNAVPR